MLQFFQIVCLKSLHESHVHRINLFLVGENEKIYSAQAAIQRLNEVAPEIEAVMIPDAGHDLTLVQADLVDTIILDFLGQDGDPQ